jgi:hypothetical protein
MMISIVDHGKSVNWATIVYFQLVKELMRWEKCEKNMIEGITKRKTKKGCMPFCHSPRSFVSKVVSTRMSRAIGEEEIGKVTTKG